VQPLSNIGRKCSGIVSPFFFSSISQTLDSSWTSTTGPMRHTIKGSRIPLGGSSERERARRVVALETVIVPAGHEAVIKSGLTSTQRYSTTFDYKTGLVMVPYTSIGSNKIFSYQIISDPSDCNLMFKYCISKRERHYSLTKTLHLLAISSA
jgi:hypothetical protein